MCCLIDIPKADVTPCGSTHQVVLHDGPNELFLIPANSPSRMYVLSCLWVGAYKRNLAADRKE